MQSAFHLLTATVFEAEEMPSPTRLRNARAWCNYLYTCIFILDYLHVVCMDMHLFYPPEQFRYLFMLNCIYSICRYGVGTT